MAVYLVIVFFAHTVRRIIAELNIEHDRLSAALTQLEELSARELEAATAVTEATTHLSSATLEQAGGAESASGAGDDGRSVGQVDESPPGLSRVRVGVYSIWLSVRPSIASRHGDPHQVVSASRNPVSVPSPTQAM